MDIKQEDEFEIKQEELIIEEGNIFVSGLSSDDTFLPTVSTTNHVLYTKYESQTTTKSTSLKSLSCEQCDYKTTRTDNFNQHLLKHTGEKPHGCDQCDYKTIYKRNLRKHLLTHARRKLYQCKHCDYKITNKGTLNKHMVKHDCEQVEYVDKRRSFCPILYNNDLLDLEIVPSECIVFNSTDFLIDEPAELI